MTINESDERDLASYCGIDVGVLRRLGEVEMVNGKKVNTAFPDILMAVKSIVSDREKVMTREVENLERIDRHLPDMKEYESLYPPREDETPLEYVARMMERRRVEKIDRPLRELWFELANEATKASLIYTIVQSKRTRAMVDAFCEIILNGGKKNLS